jgi:hypothetical protein
MARWQRPVIRNSGINCCIQAKARFQTGQPLKRALGYVTKKDMSNRPLRKSLEADDSHNGHDMGRMILRGCQWS